MSVRRLCLAILSAGDATGYEIRKESTSGCFSYFEDASYGSIYPALARLEKDGLVTMREERQPGKPARKVYSITQSGRDALLDMLKEDLQPDVFRSPFLLAAMCAPAAGGDVIRQATDRLIQQTRLKLVQLNQLKARTANTAANGGMLWAIDYGIESMTRKISYLEANRAALEAIADGVSVPDEGASVIQTPQAAE
jgi:DNA-binding PadR family transcriptional regulator